VRIGGGSNRTGRTRRGFFSRPGPAFGNNDRIIDKFLFITLQKLFPARAPIAFGPGARGLLVSSLLTLGLPACGAPQEPPRTPEAVADEAANPAGSFPSDARAGNCVAGTFFRARLLGAVNGEIDADAGRLRCEGGPRPEGQGARLYFALPDGGSNGVSIIVALPALEPGRDGLELPARLTVILEGEARFFSTQSLETCWADVTSEDLPLAAPNDVPAGASADDHRRYLLGGRLYCIAPLAEVGGMDSITIENAEFRSVLDWGPQ